MGMDVFYPSHSFSVELEEELPLHTSLETYANYYKHGNKCQGR